MIFLFKAKHFEFQFAIFHRRCSGSRLPFVLHQQYSHYSWSLNYEMNHRNYRSHLPTRTQNKNEFKLIDRSGQLDNQLLISIEKTKRLNCFSLRVTPNGINIVIVKRRKYGRQRIGNADIIVCNKIDFSCSHYKQCNTAFLLLLTTMPALQIHCWPFSLIRLNTCLLLFDVR